MEQFGVTAKIQKPCNFCPIASNGENKTNVYVLYL
jgi:hypothetical protein